MFFKTDTEHPVMIPCGEYHLDGILHVPTNPVGIILFAHGSGSSRFNTRNHFVSRILNEGKFATLLFDLLTPKEEAIDSQTFEYRFDTEHLTQRLLSATDWIIKQPAVHELPVGYFGANTGAAAALLAASKRVDLIKACVIRGGRPDLAGDALKSVLAPTLLIVGGNDPTILGLNEQAMTAMTGIKALRIIPGATHLFEEPGTLNEVAILAKKWFEKHI